MGARSAMTTTYDETVDRMYGGYLAIQAVCGILLWMGVESSDTIRDWFELVPAEPAVTDAFKYADLSIAVVASALGAYGVFTRASWTVPVAAFTAGSLVYPTAYLVAWVAMTGENTVALAVMVAPEMLSRSRRTRNGSLSRFPANCS
jgi:hypothetical protein